MLSVLTGGCYDSGILSKCAFEATDCTAGTFFHSARQMVAQGDVPCDASTMPVGRCLSSLDRIDCTNTADACELHAAFEAIDATCHVAHDDGKFDGEPPLFGACSPNPNNDSVDEGGDHCAWSKNDCTVGKDSWVNAALAASDGGCDCTKVKTGACRSPFGDYTCAVSVQGCDSETTFISMRDLNIGSDHPGVDCRLCTPQINATKVPTAAPVQLNCPSVPPTGCSVCGPGLCVTKPDVTVSFPGQPNALCGALQQAGISDDQCPSLPEVIQDICGCQEGSAPAPPTAAPTPAPPTAAPTPLVLMPTQIPSPVSAPFSCPIVPAPGCSVCGVGKCITKPDAVFSFPGEPDILCGALEQAGNAGLIPRNQCGLLSNLIQVDCGCQDGASFSPVASPAPVLTSPAPVASPAPLQFGTANDNSNDGRGAVAGIWFGIVALVGLFFVGLVVFLTMRSGKKSLRDASTAGTPLDEDGSPSIQKSEALNYNKSPGETPLAAGDRPTGILL